MSGVHVESVADGIHRVTLPLPWALNHVHCYAIEAPEGWTVVDCGHAGPITEANWREALERLGWPKIAQVIVTHYHPDHLGGARGLIDLVQPQTTIQGRVDARLAVSAWGDDADLEGFVRYLVSHGMPEALASRSIKDEFDTLIRPIAATRLVDEGDVVRIAGRPWRVLLLDGHADGHIVLHDPVGGRLLGGDVLLDPITPNVGRWEDTRPDPLGRYLVSLGRLIDLDLRIVYPGHRRMIDDPSARARVIASHHDERLDAHVDAVGTGAQTAYEVARCIWGESLTEHEERFALVEAVAHLERLVRLGRIDETSPRRYAMIDGS